MQCQNLKCNAKAIINAVLKLLKMYKIVKSLFRVHFLNLLAHVKKLV